MSSRFTRRRRMRSRPCINCVNCAKTVNTYVSPLLGYTRLAAGTTELPGGQSEDPRSVARRRGRNFEAPEAVDAFIERELPFSVGGAYGGNTSCVELVTGGEEFVLCDLGSGAREFGNRVLARHGPGRHYRFNE